jgi:signal transduction histidine kinase
MENLTFPVQILISFLQAILVGFLGLTILGFKPTLRQILLIGFFQGIMGAIIYLFSIPFGMHTLLQFIIFSLIIYLVILIPYKICFLAALLGFSIYVVIEAISIPFLLSLTGCSLTMIFNNIWLRLAFFLPIAVILMLIIFLIRRFNSKFTEYHDMIIKSEMIGGKKQSFQISKSVPLISLFLAQSFFIALFYAANYVSVNDPSVRDTLTSIPFLAVSIVVILSAAAIIMIKRVLALIENEIETKTRLDSLRHVEDLLHTIRAQRHNFCHHLQAIYGLLEVKAFHEAQDYIRDNMSEVAATSELVKTDNLGITALLQTKTAMAEARKIKLNIEVKTSLQNLPPETSDVNIILGNLVDNALEAVNEMPLEQRTVEVILFQDLKGYIFEVKNYGPPLKPEIINKIFDPGFSTKGEGRGMGLYSVDRLVKKYNGNIEIIRSSSSTCFRVYIPHKR